MFLKKIIRKMLINIKNWSIFFPKFDIGIKEIIMEMRILKLNDAHGQR